MCHASLSVIFELTLSTVAGVDIGELKDLDFVSGFSGDFLRLLADMIQGLRVPVIAAVNGYAVCFPR